jgi:hypothetical protein
VLESFENAVWIRAGVAVEQTGVVSEVTLEVVGGISLVVEATVDGPAEVVEVLEVVVCAVVPSPPADTVPLEVDGEVELDRELGPGLCVMAVVVLGLVVEEDAVTRYAPRKFATRMTTITIVSDAPTAIFLFTMHQSPIMGN